VLLLLSILRWQLLQRRMPCSLRPRMLVSLQNGNRPLRRFSLYSQCITFTTHLTI
jgi:hypothetical protein